MDPAEVTRSECLAQGQFASVFRGAYRGQRVAVKTLHAAAGDAARSDGARELAAEIYALAMLNHRRIVRMIGACLSPPTLVTEFIAGGSLHQLLHGSTTELQHSDLLRLGEEIAEAVEYLHGQNPVLVHRDLKSMNVLLAPAHCGAGGFSHAVRLCDFGLMKALEVPPGTDGPPQVLVEASRRTAGSWRYMAPECFDAELPLTEKADIWALGCLLLELFARQLPYADCANAQQVAARVLVQKAAPAVDAVVPAPVRVLVAACHAWDAAARPSAAEVTRDLFGTIHHILHN